MTIIYNSYTSLFHTFFALLFSLLVRVGKFYVPFRMLVLVE